MWKSVAFLAPVAALAACVVSVSPVVEEQDATYDGRLEGAWEEVQGSDRVVIDRGPGSSYAIEYTTDSGTGRFTGRLGRLGGRLVLDVQPQPRAAELPGPYEHLLIPGHLLLVVDLEAPDEIRLSTVDPDVLLAALEAGGIPVPYDTTESQLIVQGSTEELRSALAAHIESPDALEPQGTWRRVPPADVPPRPVDVPCFEAAAWREADALFRGDPYWRGADVASSVDLGAGRTLWLFGDTWINPTGRGTRSGAVLIGSSVAVQTGRDPSTASIEFYWGRGPAGEPASLFPDREGERLWFGSGTRVEDRLVLFMGRIRSDPGTGFEAVGWTAFLVDNPDDPPPAWRVRELETPENPLGVLVGFAATVRRGGHVYALGSLNPVKSHPIYAVRWPVERVRAGDLTDVQWWAGRSGWVPDSSRVQRWPIFEGGQSEISVHFDTGSDRFLAIHTRGFGPADLVMRAAPALTGPWTDARMVYRPPEYHRPDIMIYAGKAHPELEGADLVLTYATNTFEAGELATDSMLYYPRFVRLTRCGPIQEAGGTRGRAAPGFRESS